MDKISDIWAILLAICGLVVWSIRLEGKVLQNERDCTRMQSNVDTLSKTQADIEKSVLEQLARIRESLAKLEGLMQRKGEET